MRKIWGKFILGLANFLEVLIGGLINIMEVIVSVVSQLGKALLSLVFIGCSAFLIAPWFIGGAGVLLSPYIIIIVAFFVLVPILGRKFVSWLQYVNYSAVEFLRNYGDYLINNKENFKSYSEFSKDYKDRKEREEREREEQQQAQNDFWEEIFKNFSQGSGGFHYYNMNDEEFRRTFGGYQGQQQGYGGYGQGSYANPLNDFKTKYKESCEVLGIPEDTNIYEVKTAYRKMAKKYHPDINKDPGATEMFQKINEAYEFLSEENINRYKQMNKN
ncbi:J domain-containing protein [Miniphocaeibacter halophilus]|nr:J domain-containing protein [Miniphocaeibacter halophilus]